MAGQANESGPASPERDHDGAPHLAASLPRSVPAPGGAGLAGRGDHGRGSGTGLGSGSQEKVLRPPRRARSAWRDRPVVSGPERARATSACGSPPRRSSATRGLSRPRRRARRRTTSSTATGRSPPTARSRPCPSTTGTTATWASARPTCCRAGRLLPLHGRPGGHRHHDLSRPTPCSTTACTPADHPWPNFLISVPVKGKPYGQCDPAGHDPARHRRRGRPAAAASLPGHRQHALVRGRQALGRPARRASATARPASRPGAATPTPRPRPGKTTSRPAAWCSCSSSSTS